MLSLYLGFCALLIVLVLVEATDLIFAVAIVFAILVASIVGSLKIPKPARH